MEPRIDIFLQFKALGILPHLSVKKHIEIYISFSKNLPSIEEIITSLYITDGTVMGDMYKRGEFTMGTKSEYVDRAIEFLCYLDESILIQRLLGRAPEENSLFTNWDTSWWKIRDEIIETMEKRNIWQGKYCKYK